MNTDNVARTITVNLTHSKRSNASAWQVAAWIRTDGVWKFEVVPTYMAEDERTDVMVTSFPYSLLDPKRVPDRVVAFTIDRFGNESAHVTWAAGQRK